MSAFRYALRCDHLRVVVVLLRARVQPMFPETDADPHRLGYMGRGAVVRHDLLADGDVGDERVARAEGTSSGSR